MKLRERLESWAQHRPALLAMGIQLLAWWGAATLCQAIGLRPAFAVFFLTGLLAFGLTVWAGLPHWWRWINAGFVPLAGLALQFDWPAWVWLAAFVGVLLIFWRTDSSRVPLYLTNLKTAQALSTQINGPIGVFYDLGCGDARLLRILAKAHPDTQFVGYEHAPLTWLWARLCSLPIQNVTVHLGSFWHVDLREADVVYAFLSPAPMARLWRKACSEMGDRAQLISNSFPVPGVRPQHEVSVEDRRQTHLFCYCPSAQTSDNGAEWCSVARGTA